jgi:hypothetical protein
MLAYIIAFREGVADSATNDLQSFGNPCTDENLVLWSAQNWVILAGVLKRVFDAGVEIPCGCLWFWCTDQSIRDKEKGKKDTSHLGIPFRYLAGLHRFQQ